jgi:hypothetical protein
MAIERPAKAFRKAFSEAVLRAEVEAHGFDDNFSTLRVMKALVEDLNASGLKPSRPQLRQAIKKSLRVGRIIRAVKALVRADEQGIPVFADVPGVKSFKVRETEFTPYGQNMVIDQRVIDREFGDDLRGGELNYARETLERVFHPAFKRLIADHGLNLEDFSRVFLFSGVAKISRRHEFEHAWSNAISEKQPPGEELAAHYVNRWSAYNVFLNLLSFPARRPAYRGTVAVLPKDVSEKFAVGIAALKTLKDGTANGQEPPIESLAKEIDGQLSELYSEHEHVFALNPGFVRRKDEPVAAWYERISAFSGKQLIKEKVRQFKRVQSLERKHSIPTSIITALLRTTPLEQVPVILETGVKLGKIGARN